jgi:hypothetical protein
VAYYLRSQREMKWFIFGLGLTACYQGLLALSQRYLQGVHRVYGTIDDSNSLSVFCCTVAPVFVAAFNASIPKTLKLFCIAALGLTCVSVILTISRAGVVILGIVLLSCALATTSYRVTARKLAISLVALLCAGGLLAKSWKTLAARFHESSLKQEYANNGKLGRGYYIRIAKFIAGKELFGVGLNNWSYWVSNKYGPRLGFRFVPYRGTERDPSTVIPPDSNVDEAQAAPAHSLGALTLGELGLPGFILFSVVWLRWFQMAGTFLWPRSADPMRRIGAGIFFAFCGMFLQSLTEWVFRQSPLYFLFHILLGVLASMYYLRKQERLALAGERKSANAEQWESEPETIPLDPRYGTA